MGFLTEALKLMELEGDPRNIAKKLAQELHRGAASFLQDDKDTWTDKDFRTWIYDTSANIDREEIYDNFPHFDSYAKYVDDVVEVLNAKGYRGVHGMNEWDNPPDDDYQAYREDPVRRPSDEEYNRAAAAIKHENPALRLGGIGVDRETGDINISATLRSGEHTAEEEFILRAKTGRLELVHEGREYAAGGSARVGTRRSKQPKMAGPAGPAGSSAATSTKKDDVKNKQLKEGPWDHGSPWSGGSPYDNEEEEDPNVRHSRRMSAFNSHDDRARAALAQVHPDRHVYGIDDDPERDDFHFYDDKNDEWTLDADDNLSPRRGEENEEADHDQFYKNAEDAEDADTKRQRRNDLFGGKFDLPNLPGAYDFDEEDCEMTDELEDDSTMENKMSEESRARFLHLAGITTEGKLPAFLKNKGKKDDDKDDDKDDGKKKKPAFLNGGDDSDKKDDKKSDKKDDDKDDKKSDKKDDDKKKKVKEGLDRLRFLSGMVTEAKGKKPDADGDGVPDWADKKPGKDDKKDDKKAK